MRVLISALVLLALANCDTATTATPAVQPIEPDYDQIAQDAVSDVDTSAIEAAGW
ncbi:hypothetical protein [Tropicimonas marinistellae]|uniref:hypothetical protein n=1 Tax=Tropicimonas marinistellae TaxID=1739787 RepID=UPI0013725DD3|nr:hypothetical protein [Tropicimonas marinistellae]